MRTVEYTLYRFDELSDDAKERALDAWRKRHADWIGTAWADEWRDTLTALTDRMPWCEVKDWHVDAGGHYITASIDADYPREDANRMGYDPDIMRGPRLARWLARELGDALDGDCALTGMAFDEVVLAPLRAFIARPAPHVDLEDITRDMLHAWGKGWSEEIDHAWSDEGILDDIEASADEECFRADGTLD